MLYVAQLVVVTYLVAASAVVMEEIDIDSDIDTDGLTLLEKYHYGCDPLNDDTDGDGIPDGLDGWAIEPRLAPPRL